MGRGILFFLLLPALSRAQEPDVVERVTALMRDYARGMTENQFDVRVTISEFTSNGKLRRTRNTTHRMEFVKGRYRGIVPSAESDWEGTLTVSHAGRGTLGLEMFTDRGVWDPIFVFSPGARAKREWTYESRDSRTVAYQSGRPCATFEAGGSGFRFTRGLCGRGQVTLDEGDVPFSASFQAIGLPLNVGKTALQEYRDESLYQTVTLPGSKMPFLVPRSAVATLTFNNRKVVVECHYALRPGTK